MAKKKNIKASETEVPLTKEQIKTQLDDINAPIKSETVSADTNEQKAEDQEESKTIKADASTNDQTQEPPPLYSYHVVYSMFLNTLENAVMDATVRSSVPLKWTESSIEYMKEYIRRNNGNRQGADSVHIMRWYLLENETEDDQPKEEDLPEETARVSPEPTPESNPFNPDEEK